uniref:Protease Do-like 5, chloroplastic n=1 Tax=Tanacetum cinerariifolium TaxID=118510 RepID=A0A6L2LQ52_TANCI|nr:protease Do-like 5, chloroplastic [Tanacetum cinerariifolium]
MTCNTVKRLTKPLDKPERDFRRLWKATMRSHQNESFVITGRNLFDDEASSSNNIRAKLSMPPKTLHEHSPPIILGNRQKVYHYTYGYDYNMKVFMVDKNGNRLSRNRKIIGVDPSSDLAVLKVDVEGSEVKPVDIGSARKLNAGQSCYAIGNPYGYKNILMTRIVSGFGREIPSPNERKLNKWRKMIGVGGSDWKHYVRWKPHVVKRHIRKGIPGCLRGLVWKLISGCQDLLLMNLDVYKRLALQYRDVSTADKLTEMIQRHLEENNINLLDITGLNQLVQQLNSFLQQIKIRKVCLPQQSHNLVARITSDLIYNKISTRAVHPVLTWGESGLAVVDGLINLLKDTVTSNPVWHGKVDTADEVTEEIILSG